MMQPASLNASAKHKRGHKTMNQPNMKSNRPDSYIRRRLYVVLHRALCAVLGHPLWIVPRDSGLECGCGKIYRDREN